MTGRVNETGREVEFRRQLHLLRGCPRCGGPQERPEGITYKFPGHPEHVDLCNNVAFHGIPFEPAPPTSP